MLALKQKSNLFDERLADKEVIKRLIRELYRRKVMPIVKTTDGKYYRVEAEQEITAEDAQSELTLLQSKVSELESILGTPANQDTNNGQANTQTTAEGQSSQPTDPTPPADASNGTDPSAASGSEAAAASDPATAQTQADPNSLTLQ